jgi:hypothetical protein
MQWNPETFGHKFTYKNIEMFFDKSEKPALFAYRSTNDMIENGVVSEEAFSYSDIDFALPY